MIFTSFSRTKFGLKINLIPRFEELFLRFYVNCSAVSPFQITGGSFLYIYIYIDTCKSLFKPARIDTTHINGQV